MLLRVSFQSVISTNIRRHTIVPSPEGPHSASILPNSNSVGAATGHLPYTADILHQCGHVPTLTVTVTCAKEQHMFVTNTSESTNYLRNKVCTKSAKVAFSPGIKLSIISDSSAVSVASRHANNNLADIQK